MENTLAYDDLNSRLAAARAGEQIDKTEFFDLLSYLPASDKMLLLADVAKVLNLSDKAAQAEFLKFEKNHYIFNDIENG
jgi:hypothetical protein